MDTKKIVKYAGIGLLTIALIAIGDNQSFDYDKAYECEKSYWYKDDYIVTKDGSKYKVSEIEGYEYDGDGVYIKKDCDESPKLIL